MDFKGDSQWLAFQIFPVSYKMPKPFSTVNCKIALINNCEDEPIRFPGTVQPHGFLIVIDNYTGIIRLCSANTTGFLGEPPEYYLSKLATEVLPRPLSDLIQNGHQGEPETENPNMPVTLTINALTLDCFRRLSGSFILLECIKGVLNPLGTNELFSETSKLLTATDQKTCLQDLCNTISSKIRDILSFDRVMVYKFDSEYNGSVYAESIGADVHSFLGLHFPPTDIPYQARELYLKNPFRLIADVAYEPVPIVTLEAELAAPETVDLSHVQIRSVSPIHITYLKNMGVGASMSISIIKEGQLWGLIACHHRGPKPLIYIRQFQAYIVAQVLSSQIAAFETKEQYQLLQHLDVPLRELMGYLNTEENFIELHFEKLAAVVTLVNASGAALLYQDKIYANGIIPPRDFILSLKSWLDERGIREYITVELFKDFPDAESYMNVASGLLYKQLDSDSKTALFWFRPSSGETVNWAGNPEKNNDTSPLTPRNSFASWKELKKGISIGWNQPELDTAFRFSYLLQQHIINLLKHDNDLKNRRLNEQLIKANRELENINWISTHDLKEPLRKIQIFASMIDATRSVPTIEALNRSIEKIKVAATKMQQFIDDLFLYSKMSGIDMKYEYVDLTEVVVTTVQDFNDEKEKGIFELQCSELPVIKASRFQMQQLFTNLIDNCIKFRRANEKQIILISCEEVTDRGVAINEFLRWKKINISDRGIGFSPELSTYIFDLFKRGNSGEAFKGTGVGLSVCRKIMENHGGKIEATGIESQGTVVSLYFPLLGEH